LLAPLEFQAPATRVESRIPTRESPIVHESRIPNPKIAFAITLLSLRAARRNADSRGVGTTRLAALLTAFLAAAPICSAQTTKLLQITSPANGAVVYPGQTLKVTVTSPAKTQFETVGLVSTIVEAPLGASSVPAEFLLRVPSDIATGKYPVTVLGRTKSGQPATAFIEINVERPDLPVKLSFLNDWKELDLTPSEEFHLNVLATFADGETLEVTESASVTFRSSNAKVATVDRLGGITAIGTGSAVVSAIYTSGGRSARVAVSISVGQ
jgi:hypothetical protein